MNDIDALVLLCVIVTGAPPIKKNFYQEDPEVAGLSYAQVEDIRSDMNQLKVTDLSEEKSSRTIPNPVTTFQQAFSNYCK